MSDVLAMADARSEEIVGIPRIGDTLAGGKYRVDRVLGVGGMGAVLGAIHVELGQRVAIKVLLPGSTRDSDAVPRFLSEARAAARIQSEHVVRTFDIDRLPSGAPYIVMEQLDGESLGDLAARAWPLAVPEALALFLQACLGVAEAHARGIVHRDLKPSNLFVTRRSDGTPLVKVLDFGIVKALHPDERFVRAETTTASIMGTPQYMSPEQIRSSRSVDRRTDVWSLGVVLFEILAGTRPFDGATASEICAQIAADPPIPLRVCRPDLPAELDAVVLRCLAKERGRRFQSIGELAKAILPLVLREDSRQTVQRIVDLGNGTAGRDRATPPVPVNAAKPEDDVARARITLLHRSRTRRVSVAAAGVVIVAAIGALFLNTRTSRRAPPMGTEAAAPSPAPPPAPFAGPQPVSLAAPAPDQARSEGQRAPLAAGAAAVTQTVRRSGRPQARARHLDIRLER
jgi:serine/threonine-protein kinase